MFFMPFRAALAVLALSAPLVAFGAEQPKIDPREEFADTYQLARAIVEFGSVKKVCHRVYGEPEAAKAILAARAKQVGLSEPSRSTGGRIVDKKECGDPFLADETLARVSAREGAAFIAKDMIDNGGQPRIGTPNPDGSNENPDDQIYHLYAGMGTVQAISEVCHLPPFETVEALSLGTFVGQARLHQLKRDGSVDNVQSNQFKDVIVRKAFTKPGECAYFRRNLLIVYNDIQNQSAAYIYENKQ